VLLYNYAMQDKSVFWGAAAMAAVLALSNYLVRFPFTWFPDWLTWAAFTFPLAFLVTDCVNRLAGAAAAKKVVAFGFAFGVPLSFIAGYIDGAWAAVAARIALSSGAAFVFAQGLDVFIFSRLRDSRAWWLPPIASSTPSSIADSLLFFGLAFAGTGLPWLQWAAGDLVVKILMVIVLLPPYRILTFRLRSA